MVEKTARRVLYLVKSAVLTPFRWGNIEKHVKRGGGPSFWPDPPYVPVFGNFAVFLLIFEIYFYFFNILFILYIFIIFYVLFIINSCEIPFLYNPPSSPLPLPIFLLITV